MTGSAPQAPARHPIRASWWRHLLLDLQDALARFGSDVADTRPLHLVAEGRRGVACRPTHSDEPSGFERRPCSAVSAVDFSGSRRPLVIRRGPHIGGPGTQGPCCG
jgi:hypothetical protein